MFPALILGLSLGATTIQLSPLVGRRGEGLYRAPSYLRSVDQYARQAEEDYTVKVGNLRLQLALSLETKYEDNVNKTDSDKEGGWSMTPSLHMKIYWPLNPGFQIYSGLVIGYRDYIAGGEDADDEGFVIGGTDGAVNSQLGFDMKVGTSGLLSMSDEFVRTNDSFEVTPRDGKSQEVNRNLINLQYRNEFTDMTTGTLKLTHTDQWTDNDDYEEMDYRSDFADAVLLWQINRAVQVGPYGRIGTYNYTEDLHNDSDQYEGGLSFVYSRSERFALTGSVGYCHTSFDDSNNPTADDEYSGVTTQLAARYSNSEATTHRLIASYGPEQGELDADVNYSEELLLQYTISIQLREDLLFNGDAGYINADESDDGDEYELYRLGAGLGYRLTRNTTVDARYTREWRDSHDRDDANYTCNSVILRVMHRF